MHIKVLQLKVTRCGWWDTSGQHCPGILPHEGEAKYMYSQVVCHIS